MKEAKEKMPENTVGTAPEKSKRRRKAQPGENSQAEESKDSPALKPAKQDEKVTSRDEGREIRESQEAQEIPGSFLVPVCQV